MKITQIVQHCGGCVVTQDATLPANAAYPRRLHLPRQLAGIRHASPIAPLPCGLWAGRGGEARYRSPGKCPHAADGPQTLRSGGRWLLSKCFPPSPAAAMCSNAARLGLCALWRHATNGARPLWIPAMMAHGNPIPSVAWDGWPVGQGAPCGFVGVMVGQMFRHLSGGQGCF